MLLVVWIVALAIASFVGLVVVRGLRRGWALELNALNAQIDDQESYIDHLRSRGEDSSNEFEVYRRLCQRKEKLLRRKLRKRL